MRPRLTLPRTAPEHSFALALAGSAAALALALTLASPRAARAATLPEHEPLRIVIVSDEVNPHNLPPGELTQPGDLSAAILAPGSALVLDAGPESLIELPTNALEEVTARLRLPRCDPAAYDVLVYFCHRIPDPDAAKASPAQRQADFVAAVQALLVAGGGVVSFHHGSYASPGKAAVLDLIGATASGGVPYDTVYGQDVIDAAPGHFVTTNGIAYPATTAYADAARGVPAATYSFWNNVPDERYTTYDVNPTAEQFEVLFGGKYGAADPTPHLLGFTHRRSGWRGVVVGYQPGEYQPHACDVANPNFQALANAIVYTADALWPPAGAVTLYATKGAAGAGDVRLAWTGGNACFSVLRAADPVSASQLASRIAKTAASPAVDAPPAGDLWFYAVGGH